MEPSLLVVTYVDVPLPRTRRAIPKILTQKTPYLYIYDTTAALKELQVSRERKAYIEKVIKELRSGSIQTPKDATLYIQILENIATNGEHIFIPENELESFEFKAVRSPHAQIVAGLNRYLRKFPGWIFIALNKNDRYQKEKTSSTYTLKST